MAQQLNCDWFFFFILGRMFKNQLQELAQRSGDNLPSYACVREGPAHALRFKATVTYNGEVFEGPNFCGTLRQAEHAAAEVALNTLSERGQSLAARIRDETGVCKNLLQERAQRADIALPSYSTIRCGPGHQPVFQSTVAIAGVSFKGESAKTKKQAEKNAAMVAWASLKELANQGGSSSEPSESDSNEEQDRAIVAHVLSSENKGDKVHMAFGSQIPHEKPQASNLRSQPISTRSTTSIIRIIPFSESSDQMSYDLMFGTPSNQCWSLDAQGRVHAGTPFRAAASLAPTVKVRQMVPVFSAPPCPSESEDRERESQGESGMRHALSQLRL